MHAALLIAVLGPAWSPPAPAPSSEWALIEPPRATQAPAQARSAAALHDAAHLQLRGPPRAQRAEAVEPLLPLPLYLSLLEEHLRGGGLALELRAQGGAILARGDGPSLDAARALANELDEQLAALAIDLDVRLELPGEAPRSWTRRVQSGQESFFGERSTSSFVAGFDIEVAQDAGQSIPVLGAAQLGAGLHLWAARGAGGARVHLDGLLDVARQTALESFDPKTPDLGSFEQPRVESVQLAFSGSVAAGEALEVALSGAGGLAGEARLSIRARARPDAEPKARGWVVFDLAAFASGPRALERVDPGAGLALDELAIEAPGALLAPAALAALLEGERGDPRGARRPLLWSSSLLVLPADDAGRIGVARALLRAADASRATTHTLEVAAPPLAARFPLQAGRRARLVAGVERCFVTGYALEVATQVWMPAPQVERAFDGTCLELVASRDQTLASVWRARTAAVRVAEREVGQVGCLQLLERAIESGSGALAPAGPALELFAGASPLAVRIP